MAFDILSFVIGQQAVKGAGGSGGGGIAQTILKNFTATGTWNEAIAIDFGFVPDFLLVYPNESVALDTKNFLFYGFSKAINSPQWYFKVYSNNFQNTLISGGIDETGSDDAYNLPLNSTTEAGFRFGKPHAAGNYYVLAFKFS